MTKLNIFVINLDKDKDRRESIKKSFSKQEIKWSFMSGVYGSKIKRKGLQKFCTDGQIGCFASHYKIWKTAKIKKLEYILVCEDDIVIPDDFIEKIEETLNKHNNLDWEIITFHKLMNMYPFNKFITACCYLINNSKESKCLDKLLKLNLYGHVDLKINFSKIKVSYKDIGIRLLDCDSNNCLSLSGTIDWYLSMPWFMIPGLDITINTKTFLIFSFFILLIFFKLYVNLIFSILVFSFFYILNS